LSEFVYLKIPATDWRQIESDIEDMAGGEAEILENVEVLDMAELRADIAHDAVREYRGFSD
jgi:hypothetical protein